MTNRALRLAGMTVFATGAVMSILGSSVLISANSARATPTDTQVTVAWTDQHPDLAGPNATALQNLVFTINQTANLAHQGIEISWTGGLGTTSSSPGRYDTNYVQIMQCWGDDLPTPQQCQFGSAPQSVTSLLGSDAGSRGLNTFDPLFKRADHPELQYPSDPNVFLYPFTSVRGDVAFDSRSVFDAATTNEIDAARTGADGTGRVSFELQTTLEAPHLGCGGEVVQSDGSSYARPCWLVIVPRGDHNPDGSTPDFPPSVGGSPFTPSVWQDRIVVPLNFNAVSQSCALGQAEQRLVGNEIVADAFTSWQPSLCQSGTTYGYSMIGDSEAAAQLTSAVSGASRMAFVSRPLTAKESGTSSEIYAPVAQSALVFAYNIDYNVRSDGDPAAYAKNGTRMGALVLNQRLVAKLLTQTYRVDAPCYGLSDPVVSNNPQSITRDQEFINLNRDFAAWDETYPEGLLVALGSSDANKHVWQWIRSSPDAVDFLAGTPDEYGTAINPSYVSLNLGTGEPADSFPKSDLATCKQTDDPLDPGFGSLDMRPYYGDMQETAYRALRADANVKTSWDPAKQPPGYRAIPAQPQGRRMMIALTDMSAANRFGLDVASIVNANGETIAPTSDSITLALTNLTSSSVAGVGTVNPATTVEGAYPLSEIVYGAVNVCPIDGAMAADYARVFAYAATEGQTIGSSRGYLPPGYVPLSDSQRAVTQSAADALANVDALKGPCAPSAAAVAAAPTKTSSKSAPTEVSEATVSTPTPTPSATSRALTKDHLGLDTSMAGLGVVAGIPMCVAGPLLMRRARSL